jgi:5-(hydroxymethyl)furfural/furfural oxidase
MIHEAFVPLTLGPTADTAKTALISTAASLALDSSAALRRKIIRAIGIPIDRVSEEEAALREWVGMFTSPANHPAGTCRMGNPADSAAVVDSRCRVIGISGLSVADPSIFPTLMRAGTNLPAIMAGEKCAAEILEDVRVGRGQVCDR